MINLYVVRHGETEWNKQRRIQGQLDSVLTAEGKRQAELLRPRLETVDFDGLISSPSKRAVQTAEILASGRGLSIQTDKRLMEIHLGEWQGKTYDEVLKSDVDRFKCYRENPEKFTCKGGENFFDVKNRVEAFLADMEKEKKKGNYLIVTHGMVIRVLLSICKNLPISEVWKVSNVENTSLTIIKLENGAKELLLEGDASHIMGLV